MAWVWKDPRLPLALCEGPIVLEDTTNLLSGVIKGGCVMEADLAARAVNEDGRFSLIIEEPSASWTRPASSAPTATRS